MVRVRILREKKHCLSVFEVPRSSLCLCCLHISFCRCLNVLQLLMCFYSLFFSLLPFFSLVLPTIIYTTFFYSKHFFHSNSFSYRSCEDFRSNIFTHFGSLNITILFTSRASESRNNNHACVKGN